MNSLVEPLLAVILALGAAVFVAHFALRAFVNYRIVNDRLEVLFFGFALTQVRRDEIATVVVVPAGQASGSLLEDVFGTLKFGNRVFGPYLCITLRKGLVKRIILTPDDPEDFRRRLVGQDN